MVLESFCFAQETKAVFISVRYPKISQTQDVKSQITKRSLGELAQPNRDSAFEKKHVLFQVERSQEGLKTFFVFTATEKAKLSSNRYFWNVPNVVLECLCFPFGEIAQYFSEGSDENRQDNCTQYQTTKTTFPKKFKSCFYKYSISQDISNAGCKEPKYQT